MNVENYLQTPIHSVEHDRKLDAVRRAPLNGALQSPTARALADETAPALALVEALHGVAKRCYVNL